MGTISIMESVLRGCEELDLGSWSQPGYCTSFQACVWGLAVPTAWIWLLLFKQASTAVKFGGKENVPSNCISWKIKQQRARRLPHTQRGPRGPRWPSRLSTPNTTNP